MRKVTPPPGWEYIGDAGKMTVSGERTKAEGACNSCGCAEHLYQTTISAPWQGAYRFLRGVRCVRCGYYQHKFPYDRVMPDVDRIER